MTRLGTGGEQARLAEHIGVTPDKISKILTGTRRVQASEVPRIIDFFERDSPPKWPELRQKLSSLSDEEIEEVFQFVSFLASKKRD